MLVERFQSWISDAPVEERIEAVGRLVTAWQAVDLPEDRKSATLAMMDVVLRDPSRRVRQALASGLAPIPDAPWHVVRRLLWDVPSIASVIVSEGFALPENELCALLRGGCTSLARAAAGRDDLSEACARAVIDLGDDTAVALLASNTEIAFSHEVACELATRHAHSVPVRSALIEREDVTGTARRILVDAVANDLAAVTTELGWLSPAAARAVCETGRCRSVVSMVANDELEATHAEVEALMSSGGLTLSLLMRAAVTGQGAFVQTALSALSGLPPVRVAASLQPATTRRSTSQWRIVAERAGLGTVAANALRSALLRRASGYVSHAPVFDAIQTALAALDAASDPACFRILCELELEYPDLQPVQHEQRLLAA